MPEDKKPEESKPWSVQFREWFGSSNKPITQLSAETNIPKSTLKDYMSRLTMDITRISPERLKALYNITGLKCFEYTSPRIEMGKPKKESRRDRTESLQQTREFAETIKQGKRDITQIVEKLTSDLGGTQKLEAGLLKAQQYKPQVQERVDAIMELLNVLAEEVDYFRTAPAEEKDLLVARIQKEPENFGYITQILRILYQGDKIDSWMLLAQPPSRVKRVTGERS